MTVRNVREILASLENEYRRYKKVGEGAFEQVRDAELSVVASAEGNSIVALVWHLSGNLKSRFTDFLTSDGEKPWRNRESEFEAREVTREELRTRWEGRGLALAEHPPGRSQALRSEDER